MRGVWKWEKVKSLIFVANLIKVLTFAYIILIILKANFLNLK